MYIYNVTIKVNHATNDAWLKWMKDKHLSDVMSTNCFTKYQFVKLLDINDDEGETYSIQYYCNSREIYNEYIKNFAPQLRQEAVDLFGNSFIGFRSFLEIVS